MSPRRNASARHSRRRARDMANRLLNSTPFERKLKELREKQGLTHEQLADRLGYTPDYIIQLETGGKLPIKGIRSRLAKALQVSPNELNGDADGFAL